MEYGISEYVNMDIPRVYTQNIPGTLWNMEYGIMEYVNIGHIGIRNREYGIWTYWLIWNMDVQDIHDLNMDIIQ